MEQTPELLALGPGAVLYAILDAVVDGYAPVVAGVQMDVDEIATEVFGGDPAVSRRIYELAREMVEFQRATVNATLVSQQQNAEMRALAEADFEQNEEIKKISAWAAILFAPTLVGTIYGMNFDHMPELHWLFGYPFAITLMAVVCASLYVVFKRRSWL